MPCVTFSRRADLAATGAGIRARLALDHHDLKRTAPSFGLKLLRTGYAMTVSLM